MNFKAESGDFDVFVGTNSSEAMSKRIHLD
jgi:hypothetical protein